MAFNPSSLLPLIGKVVRVYKGGPESKVGRLIAVTTSYVLLETLNDGIVFYSLEHIKSVSEDLNASYPPASYRPADFYTRYTSLPTLNDVLQSMKYSIIRIDRGGPESRTGRLLGVSPDFFVLYTKEDGVLYYSTAHIKSFNEEPENDKILNQYPVYIDAISLNALFANLHNRWVKINRGGPEMVEGVLTDTFDDYVVVIHNKEVYRIAIEHIRNISYSENVFMNENEVVEEQNEGQTQQISFSSSKKKRVASKRSRSKKRVIRKSKIKIKRLRYSHRSVIKIGRSKKKQKKQVHTRALIRRYIKLARISRKYRRKLYKLLRSKSIRLYRKPLRIKRIDRRLLTKRGKIRRVFLRKGAVIVKRRKK